jgi:hypothetical protein
VHAFAPASEERTRMFVLTARNFEVGSERVSQHLEDFFHELAVTDNAVLETIQARAGIEPWIRGARVNADTAALRARRIVQAMLAEEAGRARTRPSYAPHPSARA